MSLDKGLDSEGLPTSEGVYLVSGAYGLPESMEVDIYFYKMKGPCCFADEIGSGGTGVDDRHDCHVSVQFTGLEFIEKVRDFEIC